MEQQYNLQVINKHSYLNAHPKIFVLLFFVLSTFTNLYSQTLSAEQIYEKVKDAVVVILAYDYNNELAKQGSGVILNDIGYVVTNYHVLSGNQRLEIMHGDEIIPYVDIIGIDVDKDILILKIESKKFPAVKISNSEKLNIGQRVYTIGSPLGFENTISEGIISGLRYYEESGQNFIQITASISPGSSGGAVVNDRGELIGISTLTAKEGQNLNFAIPIDAVLGVEISSYSKNDAYKIYELFYKGNESVKKGNYSEAIKFYTIFLEKYPHFASAYNNRGVAKINLKDYRSAIEDYNKAIEINPNLIEAYNNRGNAKSHLEDYRGAIQDYNRAIEINPNYVEAYSNRGKMKNILEDYRGTIQDCNKAIEISPNDAMAYISRGTAKHFLGDNSGACLDWSKAGELGVDRAYDLIKINCN
jgi:Flp pilus assembly protein TadD